MICLHKPDQHLKFLRTNLEKDKMKELNTFRKFLAEEQLNPDNHYRLGTIEQELMTKLVDTIGKKRYAQDGTPTTYTIGKDEFINGLYRPNTKEQFGKLTGEFQTFKNGRMMKGEARLNDKGDIELRITPKEELLNTPD